MFKKALCIILSIIIAICFASCGKSEYDLRDYSTATVLSNEEYDKARDHILNIEFTSPDLLYFSRYDASVAQDEVEYISQIGIKEIPVLLDVLKEIEDKYHEYDDYESGCWRNQILGISKAALCIMLHADYYVCLNSDDSHNAFQQTFGHFISGLKSGLSCFFLTAEAEIPEILESDTDISAKFPKLARFGILAIPYILPEIEKGKTEYEDYFTYIGLHLSNEDFIDVTKGLLYEERWEELQQNEDFTKGAEDFDYKEWLDENANDIRALLKYTEEYTQEYKDLV